MEKLQLELEKSKSERAAAQKLTAENVSLKSELEILESSIESLKSNFEEKSSSLTKIMEENLRLRKEKKRAEILGEEKSRNYQDRIRSFILESRKTLKNQKLEAENNFRQLNQSYRSSTANIVEKYQKLFQVEEQEQ